MPAHRNFNPDDADQPIGQYSQLSVVDGGTSLMHVAGQLPLTADGNLVADDFEGQARHVFAAMHSLLKAAGATMSDIAYLRTYMTRDEDYGRYKKVRAELFDHYGIVDPPPATTIVVAGLVGGSRIEIDAVVAIPG